MQIGFYQVFGHCLKGQFNCLFLNEYDPVSSSCEFGCEIWAYSNVKSEPTAMFYIPYFISSSQNGVDEPSYSYSYSSYLFSCNTKDLGVSIPNLIWLSS